MTDRPVVWSIVIPAFNEARRLPPYLREVIDYFEERGDRYEVIVVDDGSRDGTADRVREVAGDAPVRVIPLAGNEGKGAAVRHGMLAAVGAYRMFADADGATPIAELKRLEAALAGGADVAIGSRTVTDPGVAVIARSHRVVAGRLFNGLVARMGLPDVGDSQCGFKAFTARAAEAIFGKLRTRGFGFDVEVLMLARWHGFRVAEVGVNWIDKPGSKVGVLKTGPGMLWEIVRARVRMARR
ncbi:MAG: glycosyltransferase family 2 protein [Candidatus Rokubacteria bacterium]|nr:glycosyltransferase family 2 protein [Candidatus Rokubacteria bacterium]